MQRPWVGITWISTAHIQHKLRALAAGHVPLTHEGLSRLGPSRATAYLRDLLMQHGVLPQRDRHLLMFETWLTSKLVTIEDPEQRELLGQYATWHIQRKLRNIAARQPVGDGRNKDARLKITKAAEILDCLI